MTALEQKRAELAAKQKQLHDIFEEAGPDLDMALVKSLEGDNAGKVAEIKRRNTELDVLGQEIEELATVEKIAADMKAAMKSSKGPAPVPAPAPQQEAQVKGLGDLFVESAAYKQRSGNRGPVAEVPDVDLKVLMTTAAGWAPQSLRMPGYVPSAQAQPTVIDLIPFATTNQAAVVYMLETTFTNNAAGRAEGANNAGESAFVLTPTTAAIVEHAVWVPVTREQMDDVPYVASYLNNRLTLQLRQVMNTAIMAGAGAPSFSGLIGLANINTQAKGADPVMDALYKGMVAAMVTGASNPSAYVLHPLDWQDIRLTRTADGIYILGSPSESGPTRLWGLPVVQDTACTQGTAVVGDFAQFSQLVQKQGVQFEYTDSHASLFIQRTLAVLASVRSQFVVYRPAAFTQVTGI
jgi:HK97 family phage major capsid protein